MPVSIGPRIQVDGEEKYRQQISQIIQQTKTLDAEMGALTASFDKNATEQEKAQKSMELLNKQLDTARQRTELVRDMTEKSAAATGENSAQTLKWREALANAEAEQAKLEHAVQENTAAIEGQTAAEEENSGQMLTLGDAVDKVAGKLGINLPDGAKKALDGMGEFSAGTVAAMGAAAAGVAAVIKITRELADLTIEQAAQADALLTRSAQTGLDTSLLQGLDYAQRFLDFDGIDKALVKLTQNMDKARDGAEKQAAAFETLQVSVLNEDGSLRDNYETFLDVIDALGRVQNASERDALANDVFGRSYAELKPLIDAGSDALRGFVEEAENAGYVVENSALQKLGALDDAMQRNEVSANALKNTIATALAPALENLVDFGTGAMDVLRGGLETGWLDVLVSASGPVGGLAVSVSNLSEATRNYSENVSPAFSAALRAEEELETAMVLADNARRESAEAMRAATEQAQADLQALAEAYAAAYDAAYRSLDGQFGLWEQAAAVVATSVEDMNAGLDSQLEYWDTYAANFEALTSRNIEGVDALAARFTDGSKASAEALAGLADASDEEIAEIIAKLDETDRAKEAMSARFAALETDLDGQLQSISDNFADTMDELGTEAGDVDFSAFLSAVDSAFSDLESRADSAVSYVSALLAQIPSDIAGAGPSGASPGYNAAGTSDWRGGVTWVGEAGPEKVYLPPHSQIIPAQESRALAAGDQNIVINVQGIEQLDQVVRWYTSMQTRKRMM